MDVPSPAREPWRRDPAIGDRWVRSSWSERWKTVRHRAPPATTSPPARPFGAGLIEADPRQTQDYLRDQVRAWRPDRAPARPCQRRGGTDPVLRGHPRGSSDVGETQRGARASARRGAFTTRSRLDALAERLTGAICDGVETRVGHDERRRSAAGLGSSGLWLRPRLIGLADLRWDDDERTSDR